MSRRVRPVQRALKLAQCLEEGDTASISFYLIEFVHSCKDLDEMSEMCMMVRH